MDTSDFLILGSALAELNIGTAIFFIGYTYVQFKFWFRDLWTFLILHLCIYVYKLFMVIKDKCNKYKWLSDTIGTWAFLSLKGLSHKY